MRVAMRGEDRVAGLAGQRGAVVVPGAEGERADRRAREREEIDVVRRRDQPRDRGRVGPRPWLRGDARRLRGHPRAVQEGLREERLRVDVERVAGEREAQCAERRGKP